MLIIGIMSGIFCFKKNGLKQIHFKDLDWMNKTFKSLLFVKKRKMLLHAKIDFEYLSFLSCQYLVKKKILQNYRF